MGDDSQNAMVQRSTVTIEAALLDRLLALAATYPADEVCGILFGNADAIREAQPTDNAAPDRADSFEVDPQALVTAHRAARGGGPEPIGCYHSHPSGDATPSERDFAAAEPGALWLILGHGYARLWIAEPGGFREVTLAIR